MDVHHIRYFLAVCDTLNFTRAAEQCQVTQPALSRAIQQLEDEVGGLLFRRERNLTHVTDLGHLMRPHFEKVARELGGVQRDAKRFLTLDSANLNLGIMCTVGPTRFSSILANFASSFPGLSLRIIEGVPEQLARQLETDEVDLAIMANPNGFAEGFEAHRLYQERFVVAFGPGHRFGGMNGVAVEALNGESYLSRISCEYQDKLTGICNDKKCEVVEVFASEREDWIQNMVAGGMGICMMPEFSVVVAGLHTRPLIEPEVWRDICLVSSVGRVKSSAANAFTKAVQSHSWPPSSFD